MFKTRYEIPTSKVAERPAVVEAPALAQGAGGETRVDSRDPIPPTFDTSGPPDPKPVDATDAQLPVDGPWLLKGGVVIRHEGDRYTIGRGSSEGMARRLIETITDDDLGVTIIVAYTKVDPQPGPEQEPEAPVAQEDQPVAPLEEEPQS